MNKVSKLFLIAAAGLFFVGCYNDYRNPKAAKIYTRADFEKEGLKYISIKDLKAQFKAENPGMNDGTVASWTVDEPIFTSGKVISTDRYGNVYKSVYLYDAESESAIELKLNTGNYLFHPAGQIVFVKLQGLVLGNYRGMTSIGTISSNASYSNDNIESIVFSNIHIILQSFYWPSLKIDKTSLLRFLSSSKTPVLAKVTVLLPGFLIPLADIHICSACAITSTPFAPRYFSNALAIWLVICS